MGNQEKAEKGDTVMATSTRLFVEWLIARKAASLYRVNTSRCAVHDFGRTPTIDEHTVVKVLISRNTPHQ